MPKLPQVTGADLVRALQKVGFAVTRQRGSHVQLRREEPEGTSTTFPVPVPLAGDDPDVPLDLQAAFTTTYDRAGYDYALDYRRPVEPPLEASTEVWLRSVLQP